MVIGEGEAGRAGASTPFDEVRYKSFACLTARPECAHRTQTFWMEIE